MTRTTRSGNRNLTTAVLLVGGGALTAATWVGGDHGLAIALTVFYAVAGVVAYLWSGGKGDVAAIMRAGADERQRAIDRDATSFACIAMVFAALIGAVVQTARTADPFPYLLMCGVGGISYSVSLAVIRHRR
jgi:hypothetical protein